MFSFQLKPIVTQTPYLSVDLNNPIHNNYKFTDGVTTEVNTTTLVHSYEFVNNVTQPSLPSAIYCPGATGFMQVANSTNTAGESDVFLSTDISASSASKFYMQLIAENGGLITVEFYINSGSTKRNLLYDHATDRLFLAQIAPNSNEIRQNWLLYITQ